MNLLKKIIIIPTVAIMLIIISMYILRGKIYSTKMDSSRPQVFVPSSQNSGSSLIPVSPTSSVSISPTSEWGIYENSRYGYVLNYPNWMHLGTYGVKSRDISNESSLSISTGGEGLLFNVYSWKNKEILNNEGTKMVNVDSIELKNLAERYRKDQMDNNDGSIESLAPSGRLSDAGELKEVSIDGRKGYSFTLTSLENRQKLSSAHLWEYNYIFLENSQKNKYMISYNTVNPEVVQKILQSFHFITP